MSVARFIADQRTFYRVPVAVCCALLQHPTTAQQRGDARSRRV